MKLEPVFLLAPDPEPPTPKRFSRRGVLAGIGLLGLGAVAGVASATMFAGSEPPSEDELLIRFAERLQQAPTDEFVAGRDRFLFAVALGGEAGSRLAHGIRRLADLLIHDDALGSGSSRVAAATALLQALQFTGGNLQEGGVLTAGQVDRLRRIGR